LCSGRYDRHENQDQDDAQHQGINLQRLLYDDVVWILRPLSDAHGTKGGWLLVRPLPDAHRTKGGWLLERPQPDTNRNKRGHSPADVLQFSAI